MITVEKLNESGFSVISSDKCRGNLAGEAGPVFEYQFLNHLYDRDILVDECAWRTNTGTQPVGDDCEVEICYGENSFDFGNAVDVDWGVSHALPVIKWRPYLTSLEKSCNKQCLNDPKPLGQMPRCEECGQRLATEMTERDLPEFDDCDVERELAESDEWNGEGKPPIGCKCMADMGGTAFMVIIHGWNGDRVWFSGFDNPVHDYIEEYGSHECTFYKPLTPEQKAENSAIENLRDAIQSCEDLGLPVYFGDSMVTGAEKDGKSVSLK